VQNGELEVVLARHLSPFHALVCRATRITAAVHTQNQAARTLKTGGWSLPFILYCAESRLEDEVGSSESRSDTWQGAPRVSPSRSPTGAHTSLLAY